MKLRLSIKISLGIALAGLLAAIVIPNYIKARITRSVNSCTDINLRLIADAKTRWATDHHMSPGTVPQETDLLPYFKNGKLPICPAGGTYLIGPVGSNPVCSLTNLHRWKSNEVPSEN